MKIKHKIIIFLITMGLCVWIADPITDYFIFYKELPFWDLLILDGSLHETYMRIFLFVGILMSGALIPIAVGRIKEEKTRLYFIKGIFYEDSP